MAGFPLFAQQEQEQDSLVVLISAKSAQMVDIEGASYRKVIGPARFLHNNTYLLCDTALWNVETRIIDAWGDVSILQEETVLTSEKLTYLIDNDLAQFRGTLVQLVDKDHNTLRTRHLDYNTKDSVAVFMNGGAMRDKDGQIVESRNGTYDSKVKTFTFETDVNMFTDSIFVKTKDLKYESDLNLATFGRATNAWKDENMLSSERGWYDRGKELFFFTDMVHVMSQDQEGWCDSLYFDRVTSGIEMLGNAQVSDTTRNVYGLAGRLEYVDSLAKVTMTRKPAVITQTENPDGSIDTVYLGAEKLVYYTIKKCDIDSMVVVDAGKRLESLAIDPVGTFRKKAAEEAAKAAEEAAKNDPNYRPKGAAGGPQSGAAKPAPGSAKQGPAAKGAAVSPAKSAPGASQTAQRKPAATAAPPDSLTLASDSLKITPDSLAVTSDTLAEPRLRTLSDTLPSADSLVKPALPDSLSLPDSLAVTDSLALSDSLALADSVVVVPPDTTKIGFLEAIGKVKIYKKDMQVVCDSLLYSDLDSLARLFKEPIIYQEIYRQYTADSVSLVVRNGGMEKASLMSNAFIAIQEDTSHFDQIKGAEMLAYFDDKGGLRRFDVLGGANALFYLEENDALATVNKAESKMLSATFKEGELQRVYYFDQAKNDGYPVVQLTPEELKLKGFNWQPEKRPADRNAVTPLSLRPSQRKSYEARPRATFVQTEKYFPGYIGDIHRQIEVRDSLRAVRQREKAIAEQRAAERARLDSLALADSLQLADSLAVLDSLAFADSLAAARIDSLALADSIKVAADSLAVADSLAAVAAMTPEELAAAEKAAARKAAKEARIKAREEAKAARDAKKKKKQEEREARWAELDKRDAEKLAAKEAKKLEKERKRKRKALIDAARQAEKDAQYLEKYRRKYEEKKRKETGR
ncbi:MAG: hypothetical protein J6J25_07975 [Bacteroidales bacterium]|nr:hypothetical protein [Bacteroidales bacterium]